MEEDEEITRNPPFWLQHNSTTTATTRHRNFISGSVTLLLFIFFISSFLFLTPHFPILNIITTNNNNSTTTTTTNNNNRLFKKGWESINITLVLLALLFAFLVRINNNNSIESEVNRKSHDERMDWFYYPDRTDQDIGLSGGSGLDQDIGFSRNRFDGTNTNNRNDVNRSYADRHEISPPDNSMYFDENGIRGEEVNTGVVLGVRDKIACVGGLEGVTGGEIVEFGDDGTIGIVTSYDKFRDNVGVAFMGEGLSIRQGSLVKATGKIAQVPENVSELDASDDDILGKCEVSNTEIKEMPPPVRRRKRRTAESIAKNEKLSEETSGVEQKSGKISHRRTKSSGLELPGEKASHRKTKSSGFERFGTVLLVGNGIARIYGLDGVITGEVVEFEDGTIGIVTNSESANNVGVVLMGDGLLVQEGSRVKATGKVAEIPVSEAYLGSVLNALAKPIDDKGKNYGSESRVVEERGAKEMLPAVRRRKRGTTRSIGEKGKSIEETNSLEREEKLIHRKTKRTHEESGTMPPKIESSDEIEANVYESSPEKLVQDAPSPPQNERNERKSATMDFLSSLTKRKKKHRQKSIEDFDIYDTVLESQPPSPPPPSKGFFSSKKGKGKKAIEVPQPPPQYVASREQKSASTTPSAATRRPPLPVKVQNFDEERESPERESFFSGSESPMHPIPSPPPPPPFKMSKWKFVVKGDYVNIGSVNSSRSVSPEREEVDSPMGSVSGGADVATGSMFCPSPDVNSKADMFIAKFRAGLKLQKMNSIKMKPVVGFSNLGPLSSIDQAQA